MRYSSKVKALSNALNRPVEEQAQLFEPTDDVEQLYTRLLENQSIARSESESSAAVRQSRMRDYYSMWVHQIKTPISAMKLLLEAEREELGLLMSDDEQSQCGIADMNGGNISTAGLNVVELNDAAKQKAVFKELSDNVGSFEDELFRIEEYVSMALQYQRVSNTENDFVLEKSVWMVSYVIPLKICKDYDPKAYWDKLFRYKKQVYTDENGLHLYWSRYFQMP